MGFVWRVLHVGWSGLRWGADHPRSALILTAVSTLAAFDLLGRSLRRNPLKALTGVSVVAGVVWLLRRPKGAQRRRIVRVAPHLGAVTLLVAALLGSWAFRIEAGLLVLVVGGVAGLWALSEATGDGSTSLVDAVEQWLDARGVRQAVHVAAGVDVRVADVRRTGDSMAARVQVLPGSSPAQVESAAGSGALGAALAGAGVTVPVAGGVTVSPGDTDGELQIVAATTRPQLVLLETTTFQAPAIDWGS